MTPVIANGYCWHDDHAFLPAGAQSGISCDSHTTAETADPHQVAMGLFGHLNLPNLRIDMNPRLGMVAVPTWFWVEGYNGEVVPLNSTLRLAREECHDVVNRDAGGAPAVNSSGGTSTHRSCTTVYDTLNVQVRAWPKAFRWSFGDNQSQTVTCPDLSTCSAGIGLAFTDIHTPSPIAHSYVWSSLGVNGSADAYAIDLVISFGAQYRFSINGRSGGGWQDLGNRDLSWSTAHRVQEAQAVLTRP